jgi:hypothetical protein
VCVAGIRSCAQPLRVSVRVSQLIITFGENKIIWCNMSRILEMILFENHVKYPPRKLPVLSSNTQPSLDFFSNAQNRRVLDSFFNFIFFAELK